MESTKPASNVNEGIYTVVYPTGGHRTLRIKKVKEGGLAGRTIIGYLTGSDNEKSYTNFGFYENARLSFWRKFEAAQPADRLARIRRAVAVIEGDPLKAGLAYALASGKCCKCNLTLTVPTSLYLGMGPTCAKRNGLKVTKADVAEERAQDIAAKAEPVSQESERDRRNREMDNAILMAPASKPVEKYRGIAI